MIMWMADAVQETKHGFFASPVGIVILSVLSTSMAALAFALFRKIPKIFERVDGINSALMGEPARPEYGIPGRKGVIKQVEELQSSQHALEEHVTEQIDALKRQMQRELAAIRRGLRMRGEHEHD